MITTVAKILHDFFEGFGIPAYEENTVPDDAEAPYITYDLSVPDWRNPSSISATIWYKSTDYTDVLNKADEICKKIEEGLRLPVKSGGCVYLYKDNPFSRVIPTEKDNVKAVTLNIGLHALCR